MNTLYLAQHKINCILSYNIDKVIYEAEGIIEETQIKNKLKEIIYFYKSLGVSKVINTTGKIVEIRTANINKIIESLFYWIERTIELDIYTPNVMFEVEIQPDRSTAQKEIVLVISKIVESTEQRKRYISYGNGEYLTSICKEYNFEDFKQIVKGDKK